MDVPPSASSSSSTRSGRWSNTPAEETKRNRAHEPLSRAARRSAGSSVRFTRSSSSPTSPSSSAGVKAAACTTTSAASMRSSSGSEARSRGTYTIESGRTSGRAANAAGSTRSVAVTSAASSTSDRTIADPKKPAAPVTRTRSRATARDSGRGFDGLDREAVVGLGSRRRDETKDDVPPNCLGVAFLDRSEAAASAELKLDDVPGLEVDRRELGELLAVEQRPAAPSRCATVKSLGTCRDPVRREVEDHRRGPDVLEHDHLTDPATLAAGAAAVGPELLAVEQHGRVRLEDL